jgi:hypothetical protein
VDDDAVATLFDTLFGIKVAVYEIRDELLGEGDEEEEEDGRGVAGRAGAPRRARPADRGRDRSLPRAG